MLDLVIDVMVYTVLDVVVHDVANVVVHDVHDVVLHDAAFNVWGHGVLDVVVRVAFLVPLSLLC